MNPLKISVVICTYNRSESLKRTLTSVGEMTGMEPGVWELLIVDNNSNDDTRVVVEKFIGTLKVDCRYVFEAKPGLSNARNRGIREARGESIAFTDDDVLVDPDWLRNVLGEFENADVACIGGKILPIWEKPCPKCLQGHLLNFLSLQDLGEEKIKLAKPLIWGANLAIRSAMFRKYGVFDARLGHSGGKL